MAAPRKELKISGRNLWYLVGLITSDGCLSKDGRHIDITSKDSQLLISLTKELGLSNKVGVKNRGAKNQAYHIQIANKNFYDFLLSIGLTPNKSLTLKKVEVPVIYFVDFLRGLVDGDGGIQRWIHRPNRREQWNLRIASGSKSFLAWLKNEIEKNIRAKGRLYSEGKNNFRLKYGKMAAREIARRCYYESCLGLQRKTTLARDCITSYEGWTKSKTVHLN
ncbi:MAG: LAGLIDADG family homing endonuclease [Candidatus Omnitrophota bacterium]